MKMKMMLSFTAPAVPFASVVGSASLAMTSIDNSLENLSRRSPKLSWPLKLQTPTP